MGKRASLVALALAALTLVVAGSGGCGGGGGGVAHEPQQLNVSGVDAGGSTNPTTTQPPATTTTDTGNAQTRGELTAIDWNPEIVGELEMAMLDGVAVLQYSGCALRVLKQCQLDGHYQFAGLSRRDTFVQLKTADEIRGALTCSGPALATKLSGDLKRGASLDIKMSVVGTRTTTSSSVKRADLRGDCRDATHFVRGAFVGAVTMDTGGGGGGGGGGASHSLTRKDGALEDCASAKPDAKNAPAQCRALLRIEVSPIGM